MNIDDGGEVALLAQLDDEPHDLARRLGVEGRRGFIHQKNFRVLHQGPANAHPLALAAGQLIGPLIDHMIQADALQQTKYFVDIGLGKLAEIAAPEPDISQAAGEHVFHHRQALDQGVFLEDHAHAPPGLAKRARAQAGQLQIVQKNRPRGRLDQPVDAADERRFTGAGRADQRHHLAIGHLQIDVLEGKVTGLVSLGQADKPQHGVSRGI